MCKIGSVLANYTQLLFHWLGLQSCARFHTFIQGYLSQPCIYQWLKQLDVTYNAQYRYNWVNELRWKRPCGRELELYHLLNCTTLSTDHDSDCSCWCVIRLNKIDCDENTKLLKLDAICDDCLFCSCKLCKHTIYMVLRECGNVCTYIITCAWSRRQSRLPLDLMSFDATLKKMPNVFCCSVSLARVISSQKNPDSTINAIHKATFWNCATHIRSTYSEVGCTLGLLFSKR